MNAAVPMITVRELIERGEATVQTGPFGTQLKASEYVESGTPVINVRNVGFGDIRDAELEFITEAKTEQLKAHKLRKGDIVFGRKGAVERHALIAEDQDGWVQGSDCLRLRLASETVCERYASYYLRTRAHQDWMQALCSFGATMASLNQDIVKRITIPLPDLPTQRKIAAILTAYDDLIETNKRRIALLEKMAEELYREWFVRMRFPGHQKTKFVKGVPEGWEAIKIGERVTTQYGFTESANDNPSDPKFLRITDVVPPQIDWDRVPHCPIGESDEEKYLLREGDIVVARTGATVGYAKRIHRIDCRAVFASYLVRLVPKNPVDSIYFGIAVESKAFKDFIQGFVTGAAQPQANATTMSLFSLYYPGESLLKQFNEIIHPLFDQKDILVHQGRTLTRTRDLLLPRLISGKLSVKDLDVQFPPSMREPV